MTSPKSLQVQISERRTDSFWSWIVCLSSFSIQFFVGGFHSSFGTFFVALLDKFGRTEAETAWVGSMAIGITFLIGPFSTYLCHRFGCRIIACTGSVLLAISGFLTSLASSLMFMYFTLGVLNGLASSMLYFSSLVVLIEYFHKHLSLASGIATSGVGVGALIINMLSQNLISRYGLMMTFKAVAGFSTVTFVAGLAYSPLSNPRESEKETHLQKDGVVPSESSKTLLTICKSYCKLGKQWKNKGFLVWTIAMSLILFAYYIPCMYLDIGVPPAKGSLLVGFMFISQTIGKLVFGKLADFRSANRLVMAQLSLLVIAVASCLLPLAKSYGALLTYTVVQGFFDGSFVVLIGLITHDIVGKELMADAVGSIYCVISIPMTMGPPVAGMFYDFLGNYNAVFFLCSGLVCAGICIMFLIPWFTPPTLTQCDKRVLLSNENIDKYDGDDKPYDMSYVDEQKLADLFGKKRGVDLLLERNRQQLDSSYAASRPSSFVLFTIVSDEHPHDISAYTSRQELALISGTTTPLRGTPSTSRRRFHDVESRTSMFSLRQSLADVTHTLPETQTPEKESTEYTVLPLVKRDLALETVEEVNEAERKTSREDNQASEINIEITEVNDSLTNENVEDIISQDENNLRGSSWCSSDSNESWKSSSQASDATIDSGYDECTETTINEGRLASESVWDNNDKSYSFNSLNNSEKTELANDLSYYLYSCNDVFQLPELSYIATPNPQKSLWETQSSSVQSIDKNEIITYPDLLHNEDDSMNYATVEEDGILSTGLIADNKELPHLIEHSSDEDMFSLLVEDILEFEVGETGYLDSYKLNNQLENTHLYGGKYQETVV